VKSTFGVVTLPFNGLPTDNADYQFKALQVNSVRCIYPHCDRKGSPMTETALPLTMSVPQFGRLVFELGEAKSYEAATRGDIPTIAMGGKKRVPVRVALLKVAGNDPSMLDSLMKDLSAKLERNAA
jgi:hypothetical protein